MPPPSYSPHTQQGTALLCPNPKRLSCWPKKDSGQAVWSHCRQGHLNCPAVCLSLDSWGSNTDTWLALTAWEVQPEPWDLALRGSTGMLASWGMCDLMCHIQVFTWLPHGHAALTGIHSRAALTPP